MIPQPFWRPLLLEYLPLLVALPLAGFMAVWIYLSLPSGSEEVVRSVPKLGEWWRVASPLEGGPADLFSDVWDTLPEPRKPSW